MLVILLLFLICLCSSLSLFLLLSLLLLSLIPTLNKIPFDLLLYIQLVLLTFLFSFVPLIFFFCITFQFFIKPSFLLQLNLLIHSFLTSFFINLLLKEVSMLLLIIVHFRLFFNIRRLEPISWFSKLWVFVEIPTILPR